MILAGVIPQSQLTKEEQAFAQQAQQSQGPSPIEQAQLGIMQAELEKAHADTADTMSKMEERREKGQLEMQKLMLKNKEITVKMIADQQKRQDEKEQNYAKLVLNMSEQLKTQAQTLIAIKDAIGADAIVAPKLIKTFEEQVDIVADTQDNQRG